MADEFEKAGSSVPVQLAVKELDDEIAPVPVEDLQIFALAGHRGENMQIQHLHSKRLLR